MTAQRLTYFKRNLPDCLDGSPLVLNIPKALCRIPPCGETGFIDAVLIAQQGIYINCEYAEHQHVIEYDDSQITPGYTLKPEHILGVICDSALTRWVKEKFCHFGGGSMISCEPIGLCPVFAAMGICGFYDIVSATLNGPLQTIWIKQRGAEVGDLTNLFDVFPAALNPVFFTPHITISFGEDTLFEGTFPGGTDEFTFTFPYNGTYRIGGTWELKIGSTIYTYVIPCLSETGYINIHITGSGEGPV